jgi:hypothetical protein
MPRGRPASGSLRRAIRAAQAPAGGEERDGFDQVGLARAVGAGDGHGPPVKVQRRAAVRPEMREGKVRDGKAHGRRVSARVGWWLVGW